MKILIIEDERPINNLIRSTLTADGYSCDCAFDGKEGADLIEQRQYDLILLDLMLPGIDGTALCRLISPASRQVWKAGTPVELTVKEFDLLAELARHKNVVLSREKLYETVWQEEYTGETRTLDSHIQKLRKKLGWNGQIKTVFRIGYRLEEQEQ